MDSVVRVPEQLGSLLRGARLERLLTQSQVAEQLGVSVQAVSRLEKNAGKASFDRIHQLCLLFDVDLVLRSKGVGVPAVRNKSSTEW